MYTKFLLGVSPLIFSYFFQHAPAMTFLISGIIFPIYWFFLGYYFYLENRIFIKSHAILHFPAFIFLLISLAQMLIFDYNESIFQLYFLPMSLSTEFIFGWLPIANNIVLYRPIYYMLSFILMIVLNYFGYLSKKYKLV